MTAATSERSQRPVAGWLAGWFSQARRRRWATVRWPSRESGSHGLLIAGLKKLRKTHENSDFNFPETVVKTLKPNGKKYSRFIPRSELFPPCVMLDYCFTIMTICPCTGVINIFKSDGLEYSLILKHYNIMIEVVFPPKNVAQTVVEKHSLLSSSLRPVSIL